MELFQMNVCQETRVFLLLIKSHAEATVKRWEVFPFQPKRSEEWERVGRGSAQESKTPLIIAPQLVNRSATIDCLGRPDAYMAESEKYKFKGPLGCQLSNQRDTEQPFPILQ